MDFWLLFIIVGLLALGIITGFFFFLFYIGFKLIVFLFMAFISVIVYIFSKILGRDV